MSTSQQYIEYLCDQISDTWNKRYRKMFGEYMVYINEKPILLICNSTVYVKQLDCVKELIRDDSKGFPYKGAKEHYIVDIEDADLLNAVIEMLEKVIPIPVKKKMIKVVTINQGDIFWIHEKSESEKRSVLAMKKD